MIEQSLTVLAEALSARRLAGWRGLPPGLDPGLLDDEPALVTLGSDFVSADLVHLPDPAEGSWARAWLRDGSVALLEVAWQQQPDAAPLDALGQQAERTDLVDGLARLPGGEWLYPDRGLAAVVDPERRRLRRLLGFVPTTAQAYHRELRPDFATQRRPIDQGGAR